jgi:transcriptional regulator with XRE-family HTH domain
MHADLRELRTARAWSQRLLGKMASVHELTIMHIEQGDHKPHPATRKALADALGVLVESIDWPTPASVQSKVAAASQPTVIHFPVAIDPLVRATLPADNPILLAETAWYRLEPALHRAWLHRVGRMRLGNLAHQRDFNFQDVQQFLAEMGAIASP